MKKYRFLVLTVLLFVFNITALDAYSKVDTYDGDYTWGVYTVDSFNLNTSIKLSHSQSNVKGRNIIADLYRKGTFGYSYSGISLDLGSSDGGGTYYESVSPNTYKIYFTMINPNEYEGYPEVHVEGSVYSN